MPTPLPIITNGFRLANLYHSADATFVNVFWLVAAGPVDSVSVANDFMETYDDTAAFSSPSTLQSSDITLDAVEVTPLDGTSDTLLQQRDAITHGTGTSPMTAANAALVVTWLTGARGRSNRGRTFFGGIPAASLEAGSARWSTALITDANIAMQNWINALASTDSNLTLQVVSQRAESSPHHRSIFAFTPRRGLGTIRGRTERTKP